MEDVLGEMEGGKFGFRGFSVVVSGVRFLG